MKISRIISIVLFIALLISCFILIGCNVTEESHLDYPTRTTTNQSNSWRNSDSIESTFNLGVVSNTISNNKTSSNQNSNLHHSDSKGVGLYVFILAVALVFLVTIGMVIFIHSTDKPQKTSPEEAPKDINNSLYHVAKDGKISGPFEIKQLIEMAKSGELHPNDPVWCQGMKSWIPAGTLKELQGILPPPIPTDINSHWESQTTKLEPLPAVNHQDQNSASNNNESCLSGCLKGCGIIFIVLLIISILMLIFGIQIVKNILAAITDLIS